MPTEKQIQAARQNGAKSKGPKTPEGKQRSSQNATLHGMLAETVVLKNEDKAEFQLLLDAYMDQYQPIGPTETHLVEQIVSCEWRQHRAWAMEAVLFDDEITRLGKFTRKSLDQPTRATNAWNPSPGLPIPSHCSPATKPASTAATSAPSKPSRRSKPSAKPRR